MNARPKNNTMRKQIIICVLMTLIASAVFYKAVNVYILSQAEKNIQNLLLSNNGIHHYIQRVMLPALSRYKQEGRLSDSFYAPELFSSSSIVRNQHQFYNEERSAAGFPELYYKMAAQNPRNPANKADAREVELIERFNYDRSLTKIKEVVDIQGEKFLTLAIPFLQNEKPCLACHGKRADAPLDLQKIYPGEGGFNEMVGEIRAITSIRAPLEDESLLLTALCGALAVGAFSLFFLMFSNDRLTKRVAASTTLLQENEQFLKAIQDSMQVGLFLIDSSTRLIVEVNQAALDIIKLPRQEVVGRTCFFCLSPSEGENCPIMDGGQAVDRSERILIDGHGQRIPVMKSAVAVEISNKSYIIETFIDISERKKEQEHIVESEKRLRNLLESTSCAPWEFNLQTCRFTSMGTQIEKILGYPAESWQDIATWRSRLHPEDQEWASDYCASRTDLGQNHDFVYRAIHADGSCRWIRNVVSVGTLSDGSQQVLGFMQDITSQKEIELERESLKSRLQQAHKMEAIGTLAGGIAHDFNNILGVILGFAGMAKDDAPPKSKLSKDLDRILVAGRRARNLVKHILTFSRHSQIDRMVLSPQPILKEASKMLRATLPSTITIREDISPDCGRIDADPTQLHQILMNLGTNAFHAMEESGGTLTIELKTADQLPPDFAVARNLLPADFVELTVSDTGCGIPPAIIDRIFTPFFTTKEVGKGTGMGLSILYGIMHDYDGTITVSSEPGKGASFHLYFPKILSGDASAAMDQQAIPLGKERILLVDDEALLCEMGRDMLERLGYTVSTQQCSKEALAEFSRHPHDFDMVITDHTMPGMTGLELSRRILQIRPDLPIILCTGYSAQVSDETAKANGIRDFVLKPVSKTMFSQAIRKVFDGSKDQTARI